jgi:hypothetical protein
MMKEAAKALSEGHGEQGSELQRRAQRLLDQSRPDRSDEPPSSGGGEGDRSNDEDEDSRGEHGERIATGGKVPPPDDKAKAAEFRKRVLDGLGKDRSERLSPAVRRYAESLLR